MCAPWPSVRDAAGGCSPSRPYRGARRSIRPPRPRGRNLVTHLHFLPLLSSPAHVDEPPSPRSLSIPRPPTSPCRDIEFARSIDERSVDWCFLWEPGAPAPSSTLSSTPRPRRAPPHNSPPPLRPRLPQAVPRPHCELCLVSPFSPLTISRSS